MICYILLIIGSMMCTGEGLCDFVYGSSGGEMTCLTLHQGRKKIEQARDYCLTFSDNPTSRLLTIADEEKQQWLLDTIPNNFPNKLFRRIHLETPPADQPFSNCINCEQSETPTSCFSFSLTTGKWYVRDQNVCEYVRRSFICEETMNTGDDYHHTSDDDEETVTSNIHSDLRTSSTPNVLTVSVDISFDQVEGESGPFIQVKDLEDCLLFHEKISNSDRREANVENVIRTYESDVTLSVLQSCSLFTNDEDRKTSSYETFVTVNVRDEEGGEEIYEDTWLLRITVDDEVIVSVSDIVLFEDFGDGEEQAVLELDPNISVERFSDDTYTTKLENYYLEKSKKVFLQVRSVGVALDSPSLFFTRYGPPILFDSIWDVPVLSHRTSVLPPTSDEEEEPIYITTIEFIVLNLENGGIFNFLLLRFEVDHDFSERRDTNTNPPPKYVLKEIHIIEKETDDDIIDRGSNNDDDNANGNIQLIGILATTTSICVISLVCICFFGLLFLTLCVIMVTLNSCFCGLLSCCYCSTRCCGVCLQNFVMTRTSKSSVTDKNQPEDLNKTVDINNISILEDLSEQEDSQNEPSSSEEEEEESMFGDDMDEHCYYGGDDSNSLIRFLVFTISCCLCLKRKKVNVVISQNSDVMDSVDFYDENKNSDE